MSKVVCTVPIVDVYDTIWRKKRITESLPELQSQGSQLQHSLRTN